MNQYEVDNAWFKLNFGGCPYGIFSAACPVEPLHALENGIIVDCIKVMYARIGSTSSLAELDGLARKLTNLPRQYQMSSGSDKSMPRLLWKDGLTNLTELTASCKVGIMFTIVVLSLQNEGKEYFNKVFGSSKTTNDMRECFQMILCYWMWLKKDTFWKVGDNTTQLQATTAIRKMLARIIALWPRSEGQGWKLPKFHEQIHVPDDIADNGSPHGSHSGPLEHNHIDLVKKPTNRTQKRRVSLDKQLGERIYEKYVLQAAVNNMSVNPKQDPKSTSSKSKWTVSNNSSKSILKVKPVQGQIGIYSSTGSFLPSPEVLKYIVDNYYTQELCEDQETIKTKFSIMVFSEIKKGDIIYRAHPCYRASKEWYDWVMIRWLDKSKAQSNQMLNQECHIDHKDQSRDKRKYCYAPAQLLAFIQPREGVYHAIVKCCDYGFQRSSIFSTQWKMSYIYQQHGRKTAHICHINVNSIVRHSLIVPQEIDKSKFYHEIWDRCLWGDEFFKRIIK